jgi:hypothetical protein
MQDNAGADEFHDEAPITARPARFAALSALEMKFKGAALAMGMSFIMTSRPLY